MQDLRKLDFDPGQSSGTARKRLREAALGNLSSLPQAGAIDRDRLNCWTGETVETAMQRLSQAMGMPAPLAGESHWTATPPAWWRQAAALVAIECNALAGLRPVEMAALYIIGRGGDPGGGVTARLIAGRKLCRVPAAGLSRSSWQRTRRQAWMRAVWRGGEGLDPAGGWRIDEPAMSGLARHAGIHPEDPWCPLLLVRGSGSASTDRRLVECAWLTGPRHEGIAAVRKLALAVQQALATRCGLPPRETGVVALDPDSMVWSWSPATVDLSRIEEISQSSEKFWNSHVMSGTLPDAPAETEQKTLDDPELKEMLRECWAVALLRQAAEEAEKEKKTKLRELMRQRGAGRRARVEVKELCSLSLFPPDGKRLLVSALEQAGLDLANFRTGDDPVDGEAVMARLKEIAGAAEAGEVPLDRLNSLASAPPRRPGAIDPDAARSAIERAGIAAEAALPPVTRIDSAATARAGRIREETRLRLDEVISDVVELVGGG